jgi:MFS family permease
MARPGGGVARGGYGLLVLLTAMNVMNFVDRQLLASFANFIVPDLNLTNTEFGLLTGLVFIVFYAAAGLFMGALGDLTHRPRLIAAAMFAWSALTAASGLARGFLTLAMPRMFIGVGESALTPTSMSLIADHFPEEKRGFAAGFYYMGVPIGVAVSLLVAGFLGPAIGWRNCFLLLGAVGVAFSLAVLLVKETRAVPAADAAIRPDVGALVRTFLTALRASPALQVTILAGVCVHFAVGAGGAFDQLWFVRERGFERAHIAIITGLISFAGGVGGNLLGGLVSDRLSAATPGGRPMFMVWMLLALLPVNLAYRLVDPGTPLFWGCVVVAYFQLGAFYGPTFSAVQAFCPPNVRSTVVAFYILSLNAVGLGVGITGSGILVDALAAAGVEQPYSWSLFAFTVLSASAIPLYLLAARLAARPAAMAAA